MSEATVDASVRPVSRALSLGSPRFADTRLADLAREQGEAAAWRAVVPRGPSQAAAGVSGDLAVGCTDEASRGLMALDRIAVRTLCYRIIDWRLHFVARADEMAALPPRADIDPQAIFDYLYFHFIPSPRTVFQGVCGLPAGHHALLRGCRLTVAPYCLPQFKEASRPDFAPLAAEFRRRVRDAVAAQLEGSKPARFLTGAPTV